MKITWKKGIMPLAIVAGLTALVCINSPSEAQVGQPGIKINPQIANLVQPIQPNLLPQLQLQQVPTLRSICDVGGQMFGGGDRKIVQLGEDGKPQKSFDTNIRRPSVSNFGNMLLVGDLDTRNIHTMDPKTGQLKILIGLNQVGKTGPSIIPGSDTLNSGEFAGVASDGKNIFVSVRAGFSSSIYKIDPNTKQVLGSGWAGGPDPDAMAYGPGGLFVSVGEGTQIRRMSDNLEQSMDRVDLPPGMKTNGILLRGDEIRAINKNSPVIQRFKIPSKLISPSALRTNLDIVRTINIDIKAILAGLAPKNYAILICGDLAENFWGECFWNDTVWMFKALIKNGYKPEDIFVLYGDGADFNSANPVYKYNGTVTDFPANKTSVELVFKGLKDGNPGKGIPKMKSTDTLFIWTFDHGGGENPAYLCLRGPDIYDYEFGNLANALPYEKRAIFMQQCRSGGFINELQNSKTFISTASKASENAHAADTELEVFMGKQYSHGEYNYYVIGALDRKYPNGAAVNAQMPPADAFISAVEMHTWFATHENQSETPQWGGNAGVGMAFKFKP